ncbi:uncharacterized protein EDB93DRAFT_1248271 [Suillus bovinus]|uniref:uncharacterized protein n=1 Tax=Suillus bovinus TaxID=48563 RepID=UPI001B878DBF|nr:uncharacterized protein EDB93DRAFT_1248271 [Suillus bovinus]KAG2154475.1 hypothetical protein EDB93DRAFT_1248271 [Suillus bovinus]
MSLPTLERPSGSPSVKASQCVKELASRWNNMTKAAQEEETNDAVQSLKEFREMKNLALHNVPLNAFQDARSLNAHTGVEVLIIATRSNLDHFNQPHLFHTQRAADFLDACYGTSAMDVALHMEAFCITGVQGVAKTHLQEVLALKKAISVLILWKLQAEAAPFKVPQAELKDWEDQQFEEALNGRTGDRDKAGLPNSNDNTSNSDNGTSNNNDTSNSNNGTSNDIPSSDIPPPTTSATPPETQAQFHQGSKRKARTTGVSTVTTTNGSGIAVEKRARKERSDKGQKHGPRKKPCTNNSGSTASANESGSTPGTNDSGSATSASVSSVHQTSAIPQPS